VLEAGWWSGWSDCLRMRRECVGVSQGEWYRQQLIALEWPSMSDASSEAGVQRGCYRQGGVYVVIAGRRDWGSVE